MTKSHNNPRPFYYRAKILPKYDAKDHLEGFEKPELCEAVRKEKVSLLREWLRDNPPRGKNVRKHQAVRMLRYRIARCTKSSRCDCRACPVCSRRHRRWFVSEALQIAGDRPVVFLTYSPLQDGVQHFWTYYTESMRAKSTFRQHMLRNFPKLSIALGRLDVKVRKKDGRLEPHFHVAVIGMSAAELRKMKPEALNRMPQKRGKGAPWVVESVYPKDGWKVFSYIVRQRPKKDEVGRWGIRIQRKLELDAEVNRLLFLGHIKFKQAMVYLHCEHKNGLHITANVPAPSEMEIAAEQARHAVELQLIETARRKRVVASARRRDTLKSAARRPSYDIVYDDLEELGEL